MGIAGIASLKAGFKTDKTILTHTLTCPYVARCFNRLLGRKVSLR